MNHLSSCCCKCSLLEHCWFCRFPWSKGSLPLRSSECVTPLCVCVCSHLQVPDELSHGDLLSHSVVQAVAVEHHALQDGERALQNGNVHHGLVHVACDLSVDRRGGEETSFSVSGPNSKCVFKKSFISSVFVPEWGSLIHAQQCPHNMSGSLATAPTHFQQE